MSSDWVIKTGELIAKRQERLREKDPDNPLLKLVNVSELHEFGIHYNFDGPEGDKYIGMTKGEAMKKYAKDLKEEISKA